MSLITRCPTCDTMFRVVPDQLRVSEGWVRCGQCAAVFDATQNMLESVPGAAAQATETATTTTREPYADTSRPAHPAPAEPAPPATTNPPATTAPATDAPLALTVTPAATATPAHGLQSEAASSAWRDADDDHDDWLDIPLTDPSTVILETDEDLELPATDATPVTPAAPAAPATPTEPPITPTPTSAPPTPTPQSGPTAPAAALLTASPADEVRQATAAPPSFLRHEEPPTSLWRRPATRAALLVVLLALLLALGAQILLKERNRVAASAPALRPALHTLCALAGCSITPLHRIEAIVIDSSSFSRLRDDSYHLGFALRNTAPIDVAMPALELSLTDPQDQPVVRRVILPAEFGARTPALERDALWNGSLAFTVQAADATRRIVGYRLLAFYP